MEEATRGPPLMNGATPSGPGSCRVAFAEHEDPAATDPGL